MLSKYASINDRSPDIINGNAANNAVTSHTSITKNNDAFSDMFMSLLWFVLKYMIKPTTRHIMEDMINVIRYLLESCNNIAFIIGIIMNNPIKIITQEM